MKALITDLQKTRNEQKDIEAKLPNGSPSDHYLPYVANNQKVRWSKDKIPVKVYLAPSSGVSGFRSSMLEVLRNCFTKWQAKSGNLIAFTFVNAKPESDIDCFFTNNFGQVGSLAEGGEAQTLFNESGFKHCTIVLLTESATSTLARSDKEVRAVALHEIGHSLGLLGHSPSPEDIMFCTIPDTELKHPELTARDLTTIKKLY